MEVKYNKAKKITGYEIGEGILVHSHIHDPENYHLTIRKLKIFNEYLCSKTCTTQEIARYIMIVLTTQKNILENMILEVNKET